VHDGWFFTGDYARFDDDGYIWFLGRKDDIIKSFGYRVSPYEVERVMKSHAGVADCATVGEEIGKDKLIVASYVVTQPGSKVTADELLAFGTKHLAAYKAPKVVYLATDFRHDNHQAGRPYPEHRRRAAVHFVLPPQGLPRPPRACVRARAGAGGEGRDCADPH
jgi:acyl-CoA synthetase (AMP-forming)/AMP-acid ligase II